MPIPFRTTITGSNAQSTPWCPDIRRDPFAVGFGIVASSSGGIVYSVEHTFDPIFDGMIPGQTTVLASLATWHRHSTITALTSISADGNYAFPVLGIRIVSTGGGSANTARFTIVQAG